MVLDVMIRAFTGKKENLPISVRVKHNDTVYRVIITFGEIIIPYTEYFFNRIKSLEDRCNCTVHRQGYSIAVKPKILKKIIDKDGAVCSHIPEHVKALEDWFRMYGVEILKNLV